MAKPTKASTGGKEQERIDEIKDDLSPWRRWGPYLTDRAWGTVREDYSSDGNAWQYLTYDHARAKAYRWGEDGIAGICDRFQLLNFAPAFWNGKDAHLKERLYGVNPYEGNHGEDVKEYYFHVDNTPTHSYMKFLYKYPQAAFPYRQLVEENQRRAGQGPEYELLDTGIFAEDRYFDIEIEYAKAGPEDLLCRISITNRGPDDAPIHVLPHLWFRNTWSWDLDATGERPVLRRVGDEVVADHPTLGRPSSLRQAAISARLPARSGTACSRPRPAARRSAGHRRSPPAPPRPTAAPRPPLRPAT